MNLVKKFVSEIIEEDLKTCIGEIRDMGVTGILCNGKLRELSRSLVDKTGIQYNHSLTLVQDGVLRIAAFKWLECKTQTNF